MYQRKQYQEVMSRFRDLFHPDLSMIVGTGGTPVEEFLSLDIKELFR